MKLIKPFIGDYPVTFAFNDIYSPTSVPNYPFLWGKQHDATDYGFADNPPITIIAPEDCEVTFADKINDANGLGVILLFLNGYGMWLWHLSRLEVKAGDQLSQGQGIGLTGNTGYSTGHHLEVKLWDNYGAPLDFEKYIDFETNIPILPATDEQKHTIIAGDTLWELARHYYRDPYRWTDIAFVNKINVQKQEEKLLKIGGTLIIPK